MIEIGYYYKKGDKWILVYQNFHNYQKALRFMFMIKNRPNMVFMSINGDDKYEIDLIRRKTGVDIVK